MSTKIADVATAALEITKMVLVIAANTTCKLVTVGRHEIVKQYQDYQKKATPQQLAALRMFKEMSAKGTQMAKTELSAAKGKIKEAKQKIEKPAEKPKK